MTNPQVPDPAMAVINLTAWVDDYGGVTGYITAGGAETDMATGVVQAETDIAALETELGDYTGGGGAEADVATGLVQAETDIAALETELGDYTGGGGAEADVATGLVQAETDIAALETELGDYTGGGGAEADVATGLVQAETDITALQALNTVKIASKTFGFAEVAALGAVASGSIDFDAALPAGAVVLGGGINCTAIFDNAGDTASVVADLGIASGDTDAFCDGMSLDAIASVGSPAGVGMGTLVGAITPSILVDPDVNCDTITKGAAVAYVLYVEAF